MKLGALSQAVKAGKVTLGSRGRGVLQLERLLNNAGWNIHAVNEKLGGATLEAIKQFQSAWGLEQTGVINRKTLARLYIVKRRIEQHGRDTKGVGQKGDRVLKAEKLLDNLGYGGFDKDRLFTIRTRRAVNRFAKDHPRVADNGLVGDHKISRMKKALAKKRAAARSISVTGYRNGVAFPLKVSKVGVDPIGGDTTLMRRDAAKACRKMIEAARRDGITLQTAEGWRSMAKQREYWNAHQRDPVHNPPAAFPGTSNHQAGTAMDFRNAGSRHFVGLTSQYFWLSKNAHRFGFSNAEGRNVGEPWHWTYVR